MSRLPLDDEAIAVRDLAAQADPHDMMARLMVLGYAIGVPCADCGGTGTIACRHPRHTTVDVAYQTHTCLERTCPTCSLGRQNVLLASIEADRIRHEEFDLKGNRLPKPRREPATAAHPTCDGPPCTCGARSGMPRGVL